MTSTSYDRETTAAQIIENYDLSGYEAIVTGGSSGIGTETTKQLARKGAHVIIATRNLKAAQEVAAKLAAELNCPADRIEAQEMDLGSLQSVNAFTERFRAKKRPLNILINNAGVMATPKGQTKDGFETQMGTNHLGHFALFRGLVNNLKAGSRTLGKPSRVVSLSSYGHAWHQLDTTDLNMSKIAYHEWLSYANAKVANALFAVEVTRLYSTDGIVAFSVNPGTIKTNLTRHLDNETLESFKNSDAKYKSVEQGASTSIFAAVAKELLNGNNGGGLYLEDNQFSKEASVEEIGKNRFGYLKSAVDPELAKELWKASEELVSRPKSSKPPSRQGSAKH